MIGHVYFDRAFSKRFVEILEEEYDLPRTADKLWEQIYIDHISELDMVCRKYDEGVIHEFDSVDELREFDPFFLENVDSEVFDNIASVLGCEKDDVCDVYPLKQGITNLSCHFAVAGEEYVYRHPGVGTDQMIDRSAEMAAQRARSIWASTRRSSTAIRAAAGRSRASSPNVRRLTPMMPSRGRTPCASRGRFTNRAFRWSEGSTSSRRGSATSPCCASAGPSTFAATRRLHRRRRSSSDAWSAITRPCA